MEMTWSHGNSDESGFILKLISWINFNLFLKKVFISVKIVFEVDQIKCVSIEYSFNEIFGSPYNDLVIC